MTGRPPTWLVALAVPAIALIAVVVTRAVEGPSSSAAAARAGTDSVVIKNFAFHPPTLTVAKGTKLEITNSDGTTHTLSARNGSFTTGDLDGGASATIALQKSGTFRYFCEIHNDMTGTLVVR